MNKLLILTIIFISGCVDGDIALTDAEAAKIKAVNLAKFQKRHDLFRECMELAANMPRQADDDVSDIVDECDSFAYYAANQYSKAL